MEGGEISDNEAVRGGGAYLSNGSDTVVAGALIMEDDAVIKDNIATLGGGVYTAGTFTMKDGTITDNKAADGGGVFVTGTFGMIADTDMTGGTITKNEAISGHGGGVYVVTSGLFTMEAGTITANEALLGEGGGIYTAKYDYSNPIGDINTAYSNIGGAGMTPANVSGNLSGDKRTPPSNALAFIGRGVNPFDGDLLDNDNINYNMDAIILTISKEVTGTYANKNTDFEFTVYFYEDDDSPPTLLDENTELNYTITGAGITTPITGVLTLDSDGSATFTLKHGQSIAIEVPPNCYVRIMETPDVNYTTTFIDSELTDPTEDGDTGETPLGIMANRTFAFTNERIEVPPTGLNLRDTPFMILIALALGSLVSFVLLKSRQRRSLRASSLSSASYLT